MYACTVTDPDTSPFIIDEENGIVYSPSSKRADTMAQRLREMRAQRENLSPTGMSTWFFFFFFFQMPGAFDLSRPNIIFHADFLFISFSNAGLTNG